MSSNNTEQAHRNYELCRNFMVNYRTETKMPHDKHVAKTLKPKEISKKPDPAEKQYLDKVEKSRHKK